MLRLVTGSAGMKHDASGRGPGLHYTLHMSQSVCEASNTVHNVVIVQIIEYEKSIVSE